MNALSGVTSDSPRHGRPLVIELTLRFFLVFVIGLATSVMLAAVVLLLAGPAQAAAAPARSTCAQPADTAWQQAALEMPLDHASTIHAGNGRVAQPFAVFDDRPARPGALPGNLLAGALALLLTFGISMTVRHIPSGLRRQS